MGARCFRSAVTGEPVPGQSIGDGDVGLRPRARAIDHGGEIGDLDAGARLLRVAPVGEDRIQFGRRGCGTELVTGRATPASVEVLYLVHLLLEGQRSVVPEGEHGVRSPGHPMSVAEAPASK